MYLLCFNLKGFFQIVIRQKTKLSIKEKNVEVSLKETQTLEISSVQEETQIFQLMYISLFFTEKWHFLLLNHQICKDKIHNL